VIGELLIGFAAGVVAGMLGVGGGALFVPALVLFAGLTQTDAEATSLLAIIPVALVGAARQYRYGNVEVRDGMVLGALSAVGVLAGVGLANVLPERVLKLSFAGLMVIVAGQFLRRYWRARRAADEYSGTR
jgi:uncharacterized membrane protein YfcA